MLWPNNDLPPLVTITPVHPETPISDLMYNGGNLSLNGFGSSTWPSANLAIFIPFTVGKAFTFSTMFWVNGATVSGNVDVGVYNTDGVRLVSKGSTAQAGTSALQSVSVTSTRLEPGTYYLALVMDNTTGTIYRTQAGQSLRTQMSGMAQQATAFALPSTATLASVGQDFIPMVGLSTRSTI